MIKEKRGIVGWMDGFFELGISINTHHLPDAPPMILYSREGESLKYWLGLDDSCQSLRLMG